MKQLDNEIEIVYYLVTPPTFIELQSIIKKLQIKPIELVRQKEALWISEYKSNNLNDTQIIEAMVTHPILIERPIVIHGTKAIVARPLDKVHSIL